MPNQKCHQEDNQFLYRVAEYNETLAQVEREKIRKAFSLKIKKQNKNISLIPQSSSLKHQYLTFHQTQNL